jgi:DNA-binding winged helix-turn-helix (wHTH) protein/tetratricopeptide (TPR) repeat protein
MDFVYEFGPFRLDPKKRTLARGAEPVTLTAKVFETLLFLIENRDRALSKDELLGKLWPDAFVDEANLSQNIFILRKTLGDTAQDQRFIVTVRGTGYRFAESVREVDEIGAESSARVSSLAAAKNRAVAENAYVPADGVASGLNFRRLIPGILTPFAVVGVLVFLLYRYSHQSGTLTAKDTILVSDFENRTGDSIFDGTLKHALTIHLEQSPFLSMISDQQVRSTLKLMHREDGGVNREVALEVCQRAYGKAVIAGSIASVSKEYVISLEALNCSDGAAIASEQTRAITKEEVLDSLGKIATGLRVKLGESLASIHKFDVPLREATTPSLDALKAFTAGTELLRHNEEQSAAIPLFKRAIEIDPNFALAYAYFARTYVNLGENERAVSYHEKAYKLRDRISEREKLFISSAYHADVTGDLDQEIEAYNLWTQEYPRDWLPLDSLADVYSWYFGQEEKSAELYDRAWRLDTHQPFSPAGLATAYLAMNRLGDARAVLDRAMAAGLDNLPIRTVLYELAVIQGDVATTEAQVRWSESQPVQDNLGWAIAHAAAQQGRLRASQTIFERDAKEYQAVGFNETASWEFAEQALFAAAFHDSQTARRHAASSLALFRGRSNLKKLALALALAGDAKQSQDLMDDLTRRYPHDALLQRFVLPCTQAAIEVNRHQFRRALALLEPVRRYDFGNLLEFSGPYLRGLAYLGDHQPTAAAAEFQQIIDSRGVDPLGANWVLAHLGLARAYVLSGDIEKARASYEHFFALLKEAEPGIPILEEAKTEYRRLK